MVSMPSRLVLPEGAKRVVRTDFMDLALSMGDSVATSRRPMEVGSMLNLRRREDTAVRAREQTSEGVICGWLRGRGEGGTFAVGAVVHVLQA